MEAAYDGIKCCDIYGKSAIDDVIKTYRNSPSKYNLLTLAYSNCVYRGRLPGELRYAYLYTVTVVRLILKLECC